MLRPFTLGFQDSGKIILASNKIRGCRNLHNFFLGDSRCIKYLLGCPVKVKSFGATRRRHVDDESIKTFWAKNLLKRIILWSVRKIANSVMFVVCPHGTFRFLKEGFLRNLFVILRKYIVKLKFN